MRLYYIILCRKHLLRWMAKEFFENSVVEIIVLFFNVRLNKFLHSCFALLLFFLLEWNFLYQLDGASLSNRSDAMLLEADLCQVRMSFIIHKAARVLCTIERKKGENLIHSVSHCFLIVQCVASLLHYRTLLAIYHLWPLATSISLHLF